jgi:hypothetical protein
MITTVMTMMVTNQCCIDQPSTIPCRIKARPIQLKEAMLISGGGGAAAAPKTPGE